MDYTILTPDHRHAMWERTIGDLEQRHYALTMDRALALSVKAKTGEAVPAEVTARVRDLDAAIVAVEQQHAKAVTELDALRSVVEEEPKGLRAVEAVAD